MEEHSSETLMRWDMNDGGVARLQRGCHHARINARIH